MLAVGLGAMGGVSALMRWARRQRARMLARREIAERLHAAYRRFAARYELSLDAWELPVARGIVGGVAIVAEARFVGGEEILARVAGVVDERFAGRFLVVRRAPRQREVEGGFRLVRTGDTAFDRRFAVAIHRSATDVPTLDEALRRGLLAFPAPSLRLLCRRGVVQLDWAPIDPADLDQQEALALALGAACRIVVDECRRPRETSGPYRT